MINFVDTSSKTLFMEETWIIDILPQRVPKDSPGQYFRIDDYLIQPERMSLLAGKFSNFMLKLNCYYEIRFSFDGVEYGEANPEPVTYVGWISECLTGEKAEGSYLQIAIEPGNAILSISRDDTYMVLRNPREDLLSLAKDIASSEGLFIWKAEE